VQLKPCKLCKAEAEIVNELYYAGAEAEVVRCSGCGLTVSNDGLTRELLAKAWNDLMPEIDQNA
jgi:uncharacterized Zn finger protein